MEFAEIARAHVQDIYRFLLYTTGNRATAEDLAAETLERALRTFHRYDARRAKPRSWLLSIARSTAIDHYRREERRRRYESRAAELLTDPADEVGISDSLSAALEQGLQALSAADREVIALRVILEFDAKATARLLGISESAGTTRLTRALSRLEREVSRHAAL